jgi:DNA-binding NtrC family response regulator
VIDIRDLPDRIQNQNATVKESEELLSMDQLARLHAQRVLGHTGGNKVRAAEILGISRTHLYELLKKNMPDQNQTDSDSQEEQSKLSTSKSLKDA